jgi:hypothetical protein
VNCSDFQAQLDFYLDDELDDVSGAQAAHHIDSCPTCKRDVADHKQARSFLIAAVADKAAAVDVSGLWKAIEAGLDSPAPAPNVLPMADWRVRHATPVARDAAAVAGSATSARPFAGAAKFRTPTKRTTLSTLGWFQKGALTAAAAAAVFAFSLFGNGETPSPAPTQISRGGGGGLATQFRPVRIDSMEVASGHSVSTWIKPRTKTRVIWLANNNGNNFSVTPASHSR